MNFRRPFRRHAKGGIVRTIRGITELDWLHIHTIIRTEYENTAAQHKKPTEYMRGLAFALKVLEACTPHDITEVQ